ncbi:hypothetical protein GOB17_23935 [Sinorhizobium meliloti]|uniref:hypothetical protein n=1 Tax=Rhizobium meliloti TaxID=382 RepID=UPI00299EF4F5|nr:hypothetical protein [Sinorhizobium meliloti]
MTENPPPPAHWPKGVSGMTWDNMARIGVHEETGDLYWDGKKVSTRAKLETFERVLAFAVATSTVVLALIEGARFYFEIAGQS